MTAPTPAGAVRRARALASRGWAPETIEQAVGLAVADCRLALENKRVITPQAAQRITAAYEQLWNRQPPQASDADRQAAQSSMRHARARGWPPPMAWDDDLIDVPEAQPAAGWKRTPSPRRLSAELAEDVTFVREHGGYRHASISEVAMRLGVSPGSIDKALAQTRQAGMDREAG